jgi:ubiquinone/menaquinone biosynthesis C-methylase UbiE
MPSPPEQIDDPAFYDAHWQQTSLEGDPHVRAKAALMTSLVPQTVRTIVDVGCGDGALTHHFVDKWQVTAVDRSAVALQNLRCKTVHCSADAIELPDGAADLLMSSEMLEHLPDDVLAGAAAEFSRVAREWLLISVPDAENVQKRFARCNHCQHEFNIYGHLRSVDAAAIEELFPQFERQSLHKCGPTELPSFASLESLKQKWAQRWWMAGMNLRCPNCSRTDLDPPATSALSDVVGRGLDAAESLANAALRRGPQPYWLVMLLRRKGGDGTSDPMAGADRDGDREASPA